MAQQGTATATRTEAVWEARREWVARGVSTHSSVVVDHAHRAEVWDVDGKRYIDFAGGIGTVNVGHTADDVVGAIRDQAGKLIHSCFSVAIYEPYVDLARRLSQIAPGDTPKKAMFVNSGAEAVENAVKIARAYTGRTSVISFVNSFHGRTYMAMALTGRDRPYKQGFGPFVPGVFHAHYPDSYRCAHGPCRHNGGDEDCPIESGEQIEQLLQSRVPASDVAAIIVEPVQGEGGFIPAPPAFLRRLRDICDREGIILIVDEVQTGFGRTGRMFAIEHTGIEPDLLVLAKSLGGGMPLGAVVGKAEIMDAPDPGSIGGTFGGNPVACRAGLAVLDLFERDDLVGRAQRIGETVLSRFRSLHLAHPIVGHVRGVGAMVAIELVRDRETKEPATEEAKAVALACHDAGLLIIRAGLYDNVIRVLVPLAVTDEQLDEGLDILERSLETVSERQGRRV